MCSSFILLTFVRIHPKKITYGVLLLFYKALEVGEINEGTDELEKSQRRKLKVMGPRKLAFVWEFLEDVQDTCSITTEVTDSGLATHTAASELGAEEINGKLVMLFYSTLINIVKRNIPIVRLVLQPLIREYCSNGKL